MRSYYCSNRKELLNKARDKYRNKGGKEKAVKYSQENKEVIKKRERNKYKLMDTEEKNKIKKKIIRQVL